MSDSESKNVEIDLLGATIKTDSRQFIVTPKPGSDFPSGQRKYVTTVEGLLRVLARGNLRGAEVSSLSDLTESVKSINKRIEEEASKIQMLADE
jgi:hypothetical protein